MKIKAYAAFGEEGIYSPGSIMTLAVYDTVANALSDGWDIHEIKSVDIIKTKRKVKKPKESR